MASVNAKKLKTLGWRMQVALLLAVLTLVVGVQTLVSYHRSNAYLALFTVVLLLLVDSIGLISFVRGKQRLHEEWLALSSANEPTSPFWVRRKQRLSALRAQGATPDIEALIAVDEAELAQQASFARYLVTASVLIGLVGTFAGLSETIGSFAPLLSSNVDDFGGKLLAPLAGLSVTFGASVVAILATLALSLAGGDLALAERAVLATLEERTRHELVPTLFPPSESLSARTLAALSQLSSDWRQASGEHLRALQSTLERQHQAASQAQSEFLSRAVHSLQETSQKSSDAQREVAEGLLRRLGRVEAQLSEAQAAWLKALGDLAQQQAQSLTSVSTEQSNRLSSTTTAQLQAFDRATHAQLAALQATTEKHVGLLADSTQVQTSTIKEMAERQLTTILKASSDQLKAAETYSLAQQKWVRDLLAEQQLSVDEWLQEQRAMANASLAEQRSIACATLQEQRAINTAALQEQWKVTTSALDTQRSAAEAALNEQRTVVNQVLEEQRSLVSATLNEQRSAVTAVLSEQQSVVSAALKEQRAVADTLLTEQRAWSEITLQEQRSLSASTLKELQTTSQSHVLATRQASSEFASLVKELGSQIGTASKEGFVQASSHLQQAAEEVRQGASAFLAATRDLSPGLNALPPELHALSEQTALIAAAQADAGTDEAVLSELVAVAESLNEVKTLLRLGSAGAPARKPGNEPASAAEEFTPVDASLVETIIP